MARICWKCGRMHDEGESSCPFCGATFASEDETYQNDGRTISSENRDAYLRSGPPKYRRNRDSILTAIIPIIILILVAYAVIDLTGILKPDIVYDYGTDEVETGPEWNKVTYQIFLADNKFLYIDWSGISFELNVGEELYSPSQTDMKNLGLVYAGKVSFTIPSSQTYEDAVLNLTYTDGKYSFERDTSLIRSR
ncbi:zinc ribbon domain-containing protein [Methanomassiliicoccales archaeon LGM-RCC1]|nr:zinc ribbon domain-containing protein [Methanomassiliicoccales archaeon LGM-RCC1]